MYLDFHAHASISNVFMLGNNLPYHDQVKNMMYPFLMSINSPIFDIQCCNFSKAAMERGDPSEEGKSKEGSGRVAIYRMYGITRCYTLESNYAFCRRVSKDIFPATQPSKLVLERCSKGVPGRYKLVSNLEVLLQEYDFEQI